LAGFLAVLWCGVRVTPARADFTVSSQMPMLAWSGWWWPLLTTKIGHLYDTTGEWTPLVQYGLWTGDYGPLNWERTYQMTSDPRATWYGHCNGWAAASISEPEPTHIVHAHGVPFGIGEIKGLITACHQFDPVDYFAGARHDSGATTATDLRALDFHRALLHYLVARHQGLVFNTSNKSDVWSYPADQVTMNGVSYGPDPRYTYVTTTLTFPDDAVNPDFTGEKRFSRTYTYWVFGTDPTTESGTSAAWWSGDSADDHPQFVWHPAYPRAYWPGWQAPNPLDYNLVKKLVNVSAGLGL
jgi:transglutaminase elicitor